MPESPRENPEVVANTEAPEERTEEEESSVETLQDETVDAVEERLDLLESAITVDSFLEDGKLNLEKVKANVSLIPGEIFYQFEDLKPGALLEIFTTKSGEDTYAFEFQGNTEAEKALGLNMFFKHQPAVRNVEVTATTDRGNKVENGVRKGFNGSFYDGSGYVEVLSGYQLKLTKTVKEDDPELQQLKEDRDKLLEEFDKKKAKRRFSSFRELLGGEKYANVSTSHIEKGEDQAEKLMYRIYEASANAGVDPYLTMSLLQAENGEDGRFFGAMMDETTNFEAQLDWSLKIIKECELRFEQASDEDLMSGGHYSIEFIAYFSEYYSPRSAGNAHHFDNVYKGYFKFRGIPTVLSKRALERRRQKGIEPLQRHSGEVSAERVRAVLRGGVDVATIAPDSGGHVGRRRFGMMRSPIGEHKGEMRFHNGIDIGARLGTPCNSWRDGVIKTTGYNSLSGNYVIIDHGDGSTSAYAHLDKIRVSQDQRVGGGERIGDIGTTGNSTGPHLHFVIRVDGTPVDPLSGDEAERANA